MQLSTLLDDVSCFLRREPIRPNATVFITSDSNRHLTKIKAALPPEVRLVHNLQPRLVHTLDKKIPPNMTILPYLDNRLLGLSRVVGSCFTTYGRVSVHQHDSLVRKLIQWTHHDEKQHYSHICKEIPMMRRNESEGDASEAEEGEAGEGQR